MAHTRATALRHRQRPTTRSAIAAVYDGLALACLDLGRMTLLIPLLLIALGIAATRLAAAALARAQPPSQRKSQENAMGIAGTVREYLELTGRPYELVHHERTFTSMETAAAAHVPGDCVAKTVLLGNDYGYMVAVIPSTHRVEFRALRARVGHEFGLATEAEAMTIFRDCEKGAIPPFGQAYGLPVLVDERLLEADDLYCESGDHAELVHLFGGDFRALMADAQYGLISRHV